MYIEKTELGENQIYHWYYDLKYGQDNTAVKIAVAVGGLAALPGFLIPLLNPDVKINPWVSVCISLGLWLFMVLLVWGINALMYKSRGGAYRIRYIMDRCELTVFYDERSTRAMKAMGGVTAVAGVLSGNLGSMLTGTGMAAAASHQVVFPLDKVTKITLRPDKDMILLRRGVSICRVYAAPEDYETLKKHILACAGRRDNM